jgi:hypothetical protein
MEPRNPFQGINFSASLCSLAGRDNNPIPTRCLAPIDILKIPALDTRLTAISLHAQMGEGEKYLYQYLIEIGHRKTPLRLGTERNLSKNFQKLVLNRLYLRGGGKGGNTVSKQNLERFFFHKMLQIKIPKVFFYFCSVKWNFDLFSLLRNTLEQNFKSLIFVPQNGIPSYSLPGNSPERCFYFCSTVREFRAFFFSTEGVGMECREFSVPRSSQNSIGNNHLFSLFRLSWNNFFFRKFPTLVRFEATKTLFYWHADYALAFI